MSAEGETEDQAQEVLPDDIFVHFEELFRSKLEANDTNDEIVGYITQQLRDMESIELSGNNPLKFRMTDEFLQILVDCLLESDVKIQILTLRHHRLTSGALKIISALWSKNVDELCSLSQLDLDGNDVDDTGIESLTSYLLSSDCTLLSLNLNNNPIQERGGMLLAEALKVNSSVQRLLLHNCNLTLKSLIAVITCISGNSNSNIGHLDLGRPILNNYKNDEICDHISTRLLLSPNCRLQILELQKCHITDHGAILLSQALMQNTTLKSLNLEW